MSALYPFRALRPAPEVTARVAAVPYDVVTTDEARALVGGNPLSFLRVTRSEVDLPPDTNPYDARVYSQAVRNFEDLKRSAPLVLEDESSLYFYRLRMGAHEQVGLAGCFSLDEYDRDLIRKHERTRKDKEDDRTRHMIELRAQTGVVFLTYRASETIDALAQRVMAETPLYDFVAPDAVAHTIWRVAASALPNESSLSVAREAPPPRARAAALEDSLSSRDSSIYGAVVDAFMSLPALYIADGHHRVASAARARTSLPQSVDASRFLAVAFPHTQVQILPYHRVVKDLAGLSPDAFLLALRSRCRVEHGGPTPAHRGEVAMFLAGQWYAVTLGAPGGGASGADALDVALLEREILGPLLKIGDIRTDKRIDFVGGARGPAELERRVNSGDAAAAFSMYPVTVEDLMSIADAGGIMPPKSTWFEPKLRDGLLTHLI